MPRLGVDNVGTGEAAHRPEGHGLGRDLFCFLYCACIRLAGLSVGVKVKGQYSLLSCLYFGNS